MENTNFKQDPPRFQLNVFLTANNYEKNMIYILLFI